MDDRHHPIVRLIDIYARHAHLTVATVSLYASGSGATYQRIRAGADITTRRAARVVQWLSDHWPESAEWPADIPRPAPTPGGDPEPPAGGAGSSSPVLTPAPVVAGVPARGGPSSASAGPAGGGEPNPSTATCAHDSDAAADTRPPGPESRARNSGAPGARGGPPSAPPPASLKRQAEAVRSGSVTAPSAAGAAPPTRRAVRDEVGRIVREMRAAMDAGAWDRAHALEAEAQALAVTLAPDGRIASPAALVEVLGVSRSAYDYAVRQYAGGRRPADRLHPNGGAARVLRALCAAGDVRFTVRPAA